MQTDLEDYVEKKLTQGEFRSRDEFFEAAVMMYRDLEELDELRTEVARRIDEARQGRIAPLDIAELKSRLQIQWQTQEQSAS